jgi:hypothetical protein
MNTIFQDLRYGCQGIVQPALTHGLAESPHIARDGISTNVHGAACVLRSGAKGGGP